MKSQREIEKLLNEAKNTKERLTSRLKTAPSGSIVVSKGKFYRRYQNGKLEYLGKEKEPLIRALAQKKYDTSLLKASSRELEVLKRAYEGLPSDPNFPDDLKTYINLDSYTDEGFVQEWSVPDMDLIERRVNTNSPYVTMRGEEVRSKSEILIADRLLQASIPYHYEKELKLITPKGWYCSVLPDFTVLNTRTLEVWYWEHFGRIDEEKYRNEFVEKLELYAYNGLIFGKNMIITLETQKRPLKTEYVHYLIEKHLK